MSRSGRARRGVPRAAAPGRLPCRPAADPDGPRLHVPASLFLGEADAVFAAAGARGSQVRAAPARRAAVPRQSRTKSIIDTKIGHL